MLKAEDHITKACGRLSPSPPRYDSAATAPVAEDAPSGPCTDVYYSTPDLQRDFACEREQPRVKDEQKAIQPTKLPPKETFV